MLVGCIFPTVAVVPAGDAFLPDLMGSFHLKSALFMTLLLKSRGFLFLIGAKGPILNGIKKGGGETSIGLKVVELLLDRR